MPSTRKYAVLAALISSAAAQGTAWSQCGGLGWAGETGCASGLDCVVLNDYFSQCTPATVPVPRKANFWFSFGDSYTQSGFSPTGVLPTSGNPLGNPPYPGWTSSSGENWIDLATTVFNKSEVFTYNYAYGGATIDATLVAPYAPSVLSVTDQVNQFLEGAAKKPASTPWTSANSLFSIWIGINDIGNSYYLPGDRSAFSDTLLDAQFALVQKLVDAGARNFLFLNVPCVDRSPLILAQGDWATSTMKTVLEGFNSKLTAKAAAFKAANRGAQTWIWDSNSYFGTILDSPSTYGFTDATSYGSAGNFWLDNLHPFSTAHNLFAQQVGGLLESTVW